MIDSKFIEFYILKIKEFEENRLSTNERNKFWKNYLNQ